MQDALRGSELTSAAVRRGGGGLVLPTGRGGKGLGHLGPGPWSPLCRERAEGPAEALAVTAGTGEGVARDPPFPKLCLS